MSIFSKVQAFVAVSLILVSLSSSANATSEVVNHNTANANAGWCYTSDGWVPCPE